MFNLQMEFYLLIYIDDMPVLSKGCVVGTEVQ